MNLNSTISQGSFFRHVILFVFFGLLLGAGVGPDEVQGYQLPDTGQKKCYDNNGNLINCPTLGEPFYGQDAQYKNARPAYQDNGNGTVTDRNTGLIWQQDEDGNVTWQDARHICETLNLGGHDDWRIPSRRELLSIVDYGRYEPAINTKFFPTTVSSFYWSSTPTVNVFLGGRHMWTVHFSSGHVLYVNATDRQNLLNIRCVRGNPLPKGKFIDNGNGTVTDTTTGLVWERQGLPSLRFVPKGSWQYALADCERMTLAGKDDWRLPNIRELESLVDFTRYAHTIDPAFNCCSNPPHYWSSSTWEKSPLTAWIVDFYNGFVTVQEGPYFKNTSNISFRCVRGNVNPRNGNVKPDDEVFVADMNGDRRHDLMIRRGNTYLIDTAHNGSRAEQKIAFGLPDDEVFVADMDGDRRYDLVIRRDNTYLADTAHNGGRAEQKIAFGRPAN